MLMQHLPCFAFAITVRALVFWLGKSFSSVESLDREATMCYFTAFILQSKREKDREF